MKLNKLITEAHDTSLESGWWENDNVPEKLMLIVSEVSEALEEYRETGEDWELSEINYEVNDKPVGFPIELADAVIRIADLCGYLEIDLEQAVKIKMRYNRSRPYRHGDKRA